MEEYSTELEEAGSGGQLEGRNSTVSSPPDVDYSYYVYGLVALGGFSLFLMLCTCVLAIQVAVLCTRNRQARVSVLYYTSRSYAQLLLNLHMDAS